MHHRECVSKSKSNKRKETQKRHNHVLIKEKRLAHKKKQRKGRGKRHKTKRTDMQLTKGNAITKGRGGFDRNNMMYGLLDEYQN